MEISVKLFTDDFEKTLHKILPDAEEMTRRGDAAKNYVYSKSG